MKKCLVLAIVSLLISCGSSDLTQTDAKKILEENIKPSPVYHSIISSTVKSPKLNEEIIRLRSKYTSSTNSCFGSCLEYHPTEEGKKYFKEIFCYGNACGGDFTIGHTTVKEVTEVLNDKKNDSAVVNFKFYFVPLEPIYSEMCAGGKCDHRAPVIKRPVEATAKFKRYDKGWRMESFDVRDN